LAADRPQCLFFAPECPFPLVGGGAIRCASLLHFLTRRYEVDAFVFREPGAPDPRALMPPGLVRDLFVIDLPFHRRSAAAKAWRTARRLLRRTPPLVDRFSGFGGYVRRQIEGRRYDLALIEHLWCAGYAEDLAPACEKLVLDLHNIESVLHARCAATEPPAAAAAHRFFARCAERLERKWLPRFGQLLVTSQEDAAHALRLAPGIPVTVYPNAIPKTLPRSTAGEEVLVFSGNLEYHPNISAVRYFRESIWPALRDQYPNLRWRLIGKNPEAVRRYTAGDPRIETTGPVDDAVAELARGRVAIVPLLSGSGTRFKILEAWSAGVPVVSSTLGAEGLGTTSSYELLLADTPASFVAAVSRLLESPQLRRQLASCGRAALDSRFTWEAAWKTLNL
jgi:glycosyltransferase involved in cell wall biosynthesis